MFSIRCFERSTRLTAVESYNENNSRNTGFLLSSVVFLALLLGFLYLVRFNYTYFILGGRVVGDYSVASGIVLLGIKAILGQEKAGEILIIGKQKQMKIYRSYYMNEKLVP